MRDSYEKCFWEKAEMCGSNDCWLWVGAKRCGGYGNFRGSSAHRVSWELSVGPIPPRTLVLHRCDNPSCVNPSHLFLGTQSVNMRDMHAKGRFGRHNRRGPVGLTADDALSVLDMLADGISQRRVAHIHGISQTAVWAISKGRIWGQAGRSEAS